MPNHHLVSAGNFSRTGPGAILENFLIKIKWKFFSRKNLASSYTVNEKAILYFIQWQISAQVVEATASGLADYNSTKNS